MAPLISFFFFDDSLASPPSLSLIIGSRSSVSRMDRTASPPWAKSDVKLPASAITLPMVMSMKKTWNRCVGVMSPLAMSLPPYHSASAMLPVLQNWHRDRQKPESQDCALLSFLGPSCAASYRRSIRHCD